MQYLDARYTSVYTHKGFDICTLKTAIPSDGDQLDYFIDSEEFKNQSFIDVASAIAAIDSIWLFTKFR